MIGWAGPVHEAAAPFLSGQTDHSRDPHSRKCQRPEASFKSAGCDRGRAILNFTRLVLC